MLISYSRKLNVSYLDILISIVVWLWLSGFELGQVGILVVLHGGLFRAGRVWPPLGLPMSSSYRICFLGYAPCSL